MRTVSSAFWAALQQDKVNLCELITLSTLTRTFRWTSCNAPVISSGDLYSPFPGNNMKGVEESTDLGVSNADFVVANTGDIIRGLMSTNQVDMADIVVARVFTDSPDLGRMEIFRGKIGDYTYNRAQIAGQARGFQGVNQQWPYYTYQDNCVWRFGGSGCGFNTSSITVVGSLVVGSSDRLTLRVASGTLANSYAPAAMEFGRLTLTSGANSGQVRTVYSNSGDTVKLSHMLPFSLETAGVTFSIFPGCRKRLVEDCRSRYNNTSAFLGFPWIPRLEDAF